MRRKLWLLDLTLLALIALASVALRERWMEGRTREEALLKKIVPVAAPPPFAAMPAQGATAAAQYMDVVQQMLFSRDRNPTVILDPPAPPPPPPPPKPMPDFPVAYGVMNLGNGPTAILSEKPGAQHRGYRTGERIGEFKLVALNNKELVLEWEGKYVKKSIEELADRRPTVSAQPEQETTTQSAAPSQPTNLGAAGAKPSGPSSTEMGNNTRACVPGDTSPAGTVQDGFRKTVNKTPFGDSCRWEPVK